MTKKLITIIVMSLLCLSLKAENGGRTGISLNLSYKSVADSPYRDPSSGMGTIDFFGSSSNSSSPELNPVSNYYIISLGMNRDVPLFGAVSLYYRIMADYNLFPLCSYQNPDGNDFISFSVPINAKYTFEISSGLKAFAIAGFDNNIAISGIGFGLFDVKYKSFKKAQPNNIS